MVRLLTIVGSAGRDSVQLLFVAQVLAAGWRYSIKLKARRIVRSGPGRVVQGTYPRWLAGQTMVDPDGGWMVMVVPQNKNLCRDSIGE